MKKISLTMLVLAYVLNLSYCTPKKKKGGILDKLIPLALLGGGTGNGSSATNGGGTVATANETGGTGSNTGGGNGTNIPPPTNLAYDKSFYSITLNTAKTLTPTFSGTITKCEATPILPQGMSLSQSDCVISGAPTETIYPTNFVITASNAGGKTTANFKLRVINGIPVYISQWGSQGSGEGQFSGNGATIAIDSADFIYAADNNRIQKFNSDGSFISKWDGFSITMGIAVNNSNKVYASDYFDNIIKVFDTNGTFQFSWGGSGSGDGRFNEPMYVANDNIGNIYLADRLNNRVQKFDSNGSFITKWSIGSNPYGITADKEGHVYVSTQHKVQKFDSSGNLISQWGTYGSQNAQFNMPWGMKVDMSENLFIVDSGNSRIQIFDLTGNYIGKWGAQGSGNGEFLTPRDIAIDSLGNIYIADQNNYRIQKFAP